MDLLNRRAEEFQASDVLLRLPPEWSLAAIAPALIKMAKGSIHKVCPFFDQKIFIRILFKKLFTIYSRKEWFTLKNLCQKVLI